MINPLLLPTSPRRAPDQRILALVILRERDDIPHGGHVAQHGQEAIEAEREAGVGRAARPQRPQQVREPRHARVVHAQHVAQHVLLHLGHVDTPAAAPDLHPVDHEVVVVRPGLQRVRPQEVDVLGSQRRRERVVRR